MFASDLKIISLASKDVIACKSTDNTPPMLKYQKQQKYQNNNTLHIHNNNNNSGGGNRKKNIAKISTINNTNNKNHNTTSNNNQSYNATNNRKKINHQFNITCNVKNNSNSNNTNNNINVNTIKNQNIYIPTSVSNNIVIKSNTTNKNCNDSNLIPKTCCDNLASRNVVSDINSTSSFQQKTSANNLLVSSSSSLSSSTSSTSSSSSSLSTSNGSCINNNNNKARVTNRFGSAATHRKKLTQHTELDTNNKMSPVSNMVVVSSSGCQYIASNPKMSAVFTAPIVTTSIASASAPVSPSSYSIDFLHTVGVQLTGGVDPCHMGHNHHVYSSSATVSPTRNTQSMIVQGQRFIYQDIPPPEKRTFILDNGQHRFSPVVTKVGPPAFNEHPSYDIPTLIHNTHHQGGINTDNFSSPYNYPPLNSYKRNNNYIPASYSYQKTQNEIKNNVTNTPTYNRNRNQGKVWNIGNGNTQKNGSNNVMPKHPSDPGNPQMMIPRVKNHQNIHNLTYVTTDSNNNRYIDAFRSNSSSPKSDNSVQMRNNKHQTKGTEGGSPFTQIPVGKSDSFISPGDGTHLRVASEGYESDSSNSSCGKKVSNGHSNPLSSSSSSISSTDNPYGQPHSIATPAANYQTNFAEDDLPLHFYGSDQNLSHWIPALHAQFLYSAHGTYTPNENSTDAQQQIQIKKGLNQRNSFRGGRGRNYIHTNIRSPHFPNEFFFTPPDRFLARSHLIEVKDVPRLLLTSSKWDNLSQGIWNRFVGSQQTEETFKKKMRLWRYLYIIIKNAYPRFGLYLVGSTMSGFGADTSDIDMCLVSRAMSTLDPRIEALFNLTLLRNFLSKTGEFEKFNLIEAKVPILRFKDRVHNLEVDLNFNNCVGIKNTHLLFCYSQLDWRLRPLVLVTKLWAQYHNINNAKTMTISSYSLVLMVIHFLQCAVSPPVLPCLHEIYPDKFQFIHRSNDFGYVDMHELIGPYESQNTQPIGQLFLQFLQYYSSFNYSQFAISIRTGALIPVEYCRQAKSLKNDIHQWKELCIEEPFDLTNTARSVYDFETFERVKLVFVCSFRILQETLDINSIFSPLVPVRQSQ